MTWRTKRGLKHVGWIVAAGVAAVIVLDASRSHSKDRETPADPAVERTRREVRMLDDLYKTAVVLITKHYVTSDSDLPAGTAAKALFGAMKEKKWHEVRLLDAAGDPINKENVPSDAFERTAVAKLLTGADYYDEVSEQNGRRVLRAATPIPVVLEKCIMCHENYKGKKIIGALGYTLTIQ